MSIVSLDDAKAQLNIDLSFTDDDGELQDYADAVTATVEEYLGQVVEQRQIVETIRLTGCSSFLLRNTPVVDLTSVEAADGSMTWDVAGLFVEDPLAGVVTVLSGVAPFGLVTVTYDAGYATVPERFRRGALVILQHTWETQRGTGGVLSGGVIGSEETYDPRFSYSIPRKALEWLGPPLPGVA